MFHSKYSECSNYLKFYNTPSTKTITNDDLKNLNR